METVGRRDPCKVAGIGGQGAKLEMVKKFSAESLLFNETFFCFQVVAFSELC